MWLHIPSTCLPSAPELADSNSVLKLHGPTLESSVTSRGNATPLRYWRRVWKMGLFPRLLSGLSYQPSTLNRGAELWTASLREIRASQTAMPENGSAETMTGGCSTTSFVSSRACGLVISCARTSRGTPTDSLKPSSRHWRDWVTAVRSEYSARRKWGSLIDESDSLSWPTWRTPNTLDGKGGNREGEGQVQLCHQIADWSTPSAHDGRRPGVDDKSTQGRNLNRESAQWGTPVAVVRVRDESTMAKGLETRQASGRTSVPLYVGEQAERWETPTTALTDGTRHARSGDRSDELLLTGQALAARDKWTTPQAHDTTTGDPKRVRRYGTEHGAANLTDDVTLWTTPTRDTSERETKYAQGGTPLQLQDSHSPRQDQMTPDGAMYSKARRFVLRLYLTLSSPRIPSWSRLRAWVVRSQRRKLSEWFVEWLHGWPTGWTDSETPVMGFQVWLRRSRGQLSKLLSATTIDRELL